MRIDMLLEDVAGHLGIDDAITGRIVGEPVGDGDAKRASQNEDANYNPKVSATHLFRRPHEWSGISLHGKTKSSLLRADWSDGFVESHKTVIGHLGSRRYHRSR